MTDGSESGGMQFVQKSKKDIWQTPPEVYEPIADAHGGIDLDPCAGVGMEDGESEHDALDDARQQARLVGEMLRQLEDD